MNSTVFTGHKNAANMTPQQKHTQKFKTKQNELKLKSVLQVIC